MMLPASRKTGKKGCSNLSTDFLALLQKTNLKPAVVLPPCVAFEPTKTCFIYGRSQDIVGRLEGKADPECFHLPQLFPGDLPLPSSFPCLPLSFLCLYHSLCVPSRFCFAMYLLHYQLTSLRWWGFAPGWCAGPQANITSPLLHLVLQCYNCFTQTH